MNIYVFGNGNLCFADYKRYYGNIILEYLTQENVSFSVCDFRGVDTLTMELLKCDCSDVFVYHIGEKPRYLPDKYKTKVSSWKIFGNYSTDEERDLDAIKNCSHFLAIDFNSNGKRKSGTQKNIEICESLGKINLSEFINKNASPIFDKKA